MKIVLQDLTKRYPNRNRKIKEEVVAVDHFNFEIPDGQLIGLLGPSGCGKSTTLNMICGLEKPTEGRIFFGEDDVTALPPENRGVGMVFQSYALYPHLTVRQNIRFPLENLKGADKLSRQEMDARVDEAARLVQIDTLMDRKPSELSGGQQQRVSIARALVKMPRVLLLDEPLSNLDARLRLQTREEIRRIQRETGITTVFVTHDQEEAMSISDGIVVMEAGVVNQIGKPQDVYDDPINLFVAKFLGTPAINVFDGKVSGGHLYIGEEDVLTVTGAPDGDVYVGIRPEGFVLMDAGQKDSHLADGSARKLEQGSFQPEIGKQTIHKGELDWQQVLSESRQFLTVNLVRVEVMGRDTSVVSTHPALDGATVRSIISAENKIDPNAKTVRFCLKPAKVLLFDKETRERIRFAL